MRLLYLGDVVGKSGQDAVNRYLPEIKKKYSVNFTIINGENSAGGFGINEKIIKNFMDLGADAITCGDHTFDQKETKFFINKYSRLLRPHNFPKQLPGKGFYVFEVGTKKVLVIHLLCQLFMKYNVNCPFEAVTEILEKHKLGKDVDFIFVDIHGEATSEKMALAQYLDGKVSAVCGSHTHIPTADVQILSKRTAYHTDAGMCGDYDSVIGFKKEISITSFQQKIRGDKMQTAEGEGTLCGTLIELEDLTGLAKQIDYVRVGGRLKTHLPNF
jgi:hypothetical protein